MKKKLKTAILLCAGKSTRTYPLTLNRPKPLLEAGGISILEHNLRGLVEVASDVVIVAGFEAQQIKDFVSKLRLPSLKVRVIEQRVQLGTGHAVLQAESMVRGQFLVVNGDIFYSAKDIAALAAQDIAILGAQVSDHTQFGMIVTKAGAVTGVVEKPTEKVSEFANAGAYAFDSAIFPILKKIKKSASGEYYLTDAISELSSTKKVVLVPSKDYWLHIGYPWDLLTANEFLLARAKPVIAKDAIIEKGATIKGSVSIGSKTLVRAGAYIEGPVSIGKDCIIGPNIHIRPSTMIGNGCKVGNGCEIKNSIIYDGTAISHLCYIGDSVIGRNVNIGGGTITANLRHDKMPVSSMVNGTLVSTGHSKFGTAIGDNAKIAINTSIYPGRKIWPFKTTLPGEQVQKDVM